MDRWECLTEPLLVWFSENARAMPWRSDPTPYHIWISEIMLQQTRVSAVIPYYERFLRELPDMESLACCEDEKLMKLWEGLGYYSRARNLKKAALVVMENYGGVFPSDYASLRSLPGIGDYTAGAILSIAFGVPEPAVDGNVLRVVSRITGDFSDITLESTRRSCRNLIRSCMPKGKTSEYTQALMELGATVCLPNGTPLCHLCPGANLCTAREQGVTSLLPVKTPSKPRREERRTVFFIFCDGKVALRRRPKKGLLSGLWEFPNELEGISLSDLGIDGNVTGTFGKGKHVFSHIEWHMDSVTVVAQSPKLPEGYVWADAKELQEAYAIPAAFRDFSQPLASYCNKNPL